MEEVFRAVLVAMPMRLMFRIRRGMGMTRSRITIIDFDRESRVGLFRDLLSRVPVKSDLERTGVHKSWLIFKNLLYAQREFILRSMRSYIGCKRLT